jgi:hypothetical protein
MGLQYRGWGLTAAMGYNIWGGASPLPWATLVEADASGDGEGVGRSGGRCGGVTWAARAMKPGLCGGGRIETLPWSPGKI